LFNFDKTSKMDPSHLKSFEVSGFKKFANLKVEDIGLFNLVIGDNNVGKTSLLEALTATDPTNLFTSALAAINFHIKKNRQIKGNFFDQYFSSKPNGRKSDIDFTLTEINGDFRQIRIPSSSPSEIFSGRKNEILAKDDNFHAVSNNINISFNENYYDLENPFIPFGSLYDHELTRIYSENIQLFVDKKEHFIKAVSTMLPKIKNIEVSTGYAASPVLLVAEEGKNNLAPLASLGDGTIKLFRILLSLFAKKNNYNRVMIDEIDSGIHYSRLKEFLKSLLQISVSEEKQFFATTHSRECIEHFIDAINESGLKNESRVIRLAETPKGIKAYTMQFEEFEKAILADSEIR
jgi:AAA15 family ATPase/GTPase